MKIDLLHGSMKQSLSWNDFPGQSMPVLDGAGHSQTLVLRCFPQSHVALHLLKSFQGHH